MSEANEVERVVMLPYFHKMTDVKFDELSERGMTWLEIKEKYVQPKWCSYPDALDGNLGCWSLVGRKIKCRKDCGNCELINET